MQSFVQKIVIVIFFIGLGLEGFAFWKSTGIADSTGPMITMDEDQVTVSITSGQEEILSGITAWDTKDGDVTESLVIQGMSNFIEPGVRRATIAAFDRDNHVTKIEREIIYSDYTSPRFSLEMPLRFPVSNNMSLNNTFEVQDCLDGNLTNHVTISLENKEDSLDPSMVNDIRVIYKVVNSAGDVVNLPVTVTYYDSADDYSVPRCILSQYLVYMKTGESFDPAAYITGVSVNNRERTMQEMAEILAQNPEAQGLYTYSNIRVNNTVNSAEPGVYEVTYQMIGENEAKSIIRLIVVVED